ncbi:hypothetical protein QCA50_013126 [Cerrena zonata]|uniref:Uncharacterized protein n=1 Tax=Cerrena zonata TaxID=2478898 RepID=A0AAW0FXY1_9APHY
MATPMWSIFVSERGSFGPFIDQYLDRWIHSDQLVTIAPWHLTITGWWNRPGPQPTVICTGTRIVDIPDEQAGRSLIMTKK